MADIHVETIRRVDAFDEYDDAYLREDFMDQLNIFDIIGEFDYQYTRPSRRETIFNYVIPSEIQVIIHPFSLKDSESILIDCPICLESNLQKEIQFNCGHSYCVDCMSSYLKTTLSKNENNIPKCAYCRETIGQLQVENHELHYHFTKLIENLDNE